MSSTFSKKIRYYSERCRNAIWMLRTGRFKLFFKSLYIEFYPTVKEVQTLLHVEEVRTLLHIEERSVADSEFVDKRKLPRPSFRPTVSQPFSEAGMRADSGVVANELRQILSSIKVQEKSNS
jgi:hypothetical protein